MQNFTINSHDIKKFLEKVVDHEGLKPSIYTCSLCKNILFEPLECGNCFKPFCRVCLIEKL